MDVYIIHISHTKGANERNQLCDKYRKNIDKLNTIMMTNCPKYAEALKWHKN